MKNSKSSGKVLALAAPYDRLSGEGALVGSIFGVATIDVLSGVVADFLTHGVVALKKVGSQAWVVGDLIYWDNSAKQATKTSTSNTLIGQCTKAVGSGAGEVVGDVKLIPLGDSDPGNLSRAANVPAIGVTTNLVGVDGTGSNAAPLVGTENRLDVIEAKVDAVIAALVAANLMAAP